MDNENEPQSLPKEEIKSGYVLSEDIAELPFLKKGRVLTPMDVEQIKKSKMTNNISVFMLNKVQKDEEKYQGGPMEVVRTLSWKDEISDEEKDDALLAIGASDKVRESVEYKKNYIRGDNYEERVATKEQFHKDKFQEYLKASSVNERNAALHIINRYAISSSDLEGLDTLDGVQTKELIEKLDRYEGNTLRFLDTVVERETVRIPYVEDIIIDMLNDVGLNLARALLGHAAKNEFMNDFLTTHSLQVLLVALVTAMEMTKMVQEKADKLSHHDINTFLALEKKVFSLEDLMNIGIAALLHDIEFKKRMPNLTPDYKFSSREESIIETHPASGFHLAKKLDLDFDVQRAIHQQSERFDGSGFPTGVFPRMFSKYTPVIMFAEYYVETTTQNPFTEQHLLPREALVDILSHKRKQFDGDVVYAFIRAASLFPVGSWLQLSDGRVGMVTDVNPESLDRPVVTAFIDNKGNILTPLDINLMENEIKIIKPIAVDRVKEVMGETYRQIWKR